MYITIQYTEYQTLFHIGVNKDQIFGVLTFFASTLSKKLQYQFVVCICVLIVTYNIIQLSLCCDVYRICAGKRYLFNAEYLGIENYKRMRIEAAERFGCTKGICVMLMCWVH